MHISNIRFLSSLVTCCTLLSACSSGGGGFDVDSVTSPTEAPPPSYQDDKSVTPPKEASLSEMQTPGLGYAMKLKMRNWLKVKRQNLDEGGDLSASEWEMLSAPNAIELLKQKVDNAEKTSGDAFSSDNGAGPFHTRDFKYVKSGFYYKNYRNLNFANKLAMTGYEGYLFYHGDNPARALPTEGIINYKGNWDFMTTAKIGTNYESYSSLANAGKAGDRRSAISEDLDSLLSNKSEAPSADHQDYGLSTEIQVNFGDKKLSGKLYLNSRELAKAEKTRKLPVYTLNGDVHGNRFSGSATAEKSAELAELGSHPFTSNATNSLEGGIYGPNGEELAGKFLTDDNQVFVVFAAKHQDKLNSETRFDAKKVRANWSAESKKDDDFVMKDTTSFGEINYLVVDGQRISLLPEKDNQDFVETATRNINGMENNIRVCCGNLGYLKFGTYWVDGAKAYDLFLVGERTTLADMEKAAQASGEVRYKGTWEGIITDGKTSYGAVASKDAAGDVAEFKVDFANKTLTGELKRDTSLNTVFNINAQISGNEFTGTASTPDNGFALNAGSTLGDSRVHVNSTVKGAFYGPQASELGGGFAGNEFPGSTDKAAVVFGAKRQVIAKP